MSDFQLALLYGCILRCVLIASGTLSLYLGYRLFYIPLKNAAESELSAELGKSKLGFRSAASGLFFALFGSCIIGTAVYRPLEITRVEPVQDPSQDQAAQAQIEPERASTRQPASGVTPGGNSQVAAPQILIAERVAEPNSSGVQPPKKEGAAADNQANKAGDRPSVNEPGQEIFDLKKLKIGIKYIIVKCPDGKLKIVDEYGHIYRFNGYKILYDSSKDVCRVIYSS
jgi:hypothetical protein